jgi:hypothetical protein
VRNEEAGKVLIKHTGLGRSHEKSIVFAAAEKGMSIAAIEWLNWCQKFITKEIASLIIKAYQEMFDPRITRESIS